MVRATLAVSALLSCAIASTSALAVHEHEHVARTALPDTWAHPRDSPFHPLFKRQSAAPAVGSSAWAKQYPPWKADSSKLPQAWVDAYNAAKNAGKIPDLAPSTQSNGGNPTYGGLSPTSAKVCSSTYQCRANGSIWDAPSGVVGISFDDGPLPPSPKLYDFLKQNNQKATHFYIGTNILTNIKIFQQAFNNGDDLAVHTWTHPYMTTLSDLDVLGELGWTIQIIHDSSGGNVPRFWRPPYGDSDVRVQAIASAVFGLQTIIWNKDSADWSIASGSTTQPKVIAQITNDYTKDAKSPGLVYLEHELTDTTVQIFMDTYPLIAQNGWKAESLATLYPNLGGVYQQPGDAAPLGVFGANATAAPSAPAGGSATSAPSGVSTGVAGSGSASAGGAQATVPAQQHAATGAASVLSPSALLSLLVALAFGMIST